MPQTLKSLVKKRGELKAQLTRFKNYLRSDSVDVIETETRLEEVNSLLNRFKNIQSQIEEFDSNSDEADSQLECFELEYYQVVTLAKKSIKSIEKIDDTNNIKIKLPTFSLPEFSGDYSKWLSFKDAFITLVGNNKSLDNFQKNYYLRDCLKGKASEILDALEITQDNFEIAWQVLSNRFENKRVIANQHLYSLFKLKELKQESHVALRNLLDQTQLHLNSLKNIGLPTEYWDVIIIYILANKLDSNTRIYWEQYPTKEKIPTLQEFLKCLTDRAIVLEASEATCSTAKPVFAHHKPSSYKKESSVSLLSQRLKCIVCKENHKIYFCKQFLKLNQHERFEKIKQLQACIKCLNVGHSTKECRSKNNCRTCNKAGHNTLLHIFPKEDQDTENSMDQVPVSNHSTFGETEKTILLSTAMVNVKDSNGIIHSARVLLDNGSQVNFITERFAKKLNIKYKSLNMPVSGLHNNITNIKKSISFEFSSINSNYKKLVTCLVLQEITSKLPQTSFPKREANIPPGLKLADPEFSTSGHVDILLGSELFWEMLTTDQLRLGTIGPTLQRTELGWILSGPIRTCTTKKEQESSSCHLSLNMIHNQIERFWKQEELVSIKHQNYEEKACEESFTSTQKRDENGRFEVSLPFRPCIDQIGTSLPMAKKRFLNLEKKLSSNMDLKLQYIKFMEEYENLGHMTKFEPVSNEEKSYYLPHHAIKKETSSTTKLRVVFDGSAKTSSGISINDALMVGPIIQNDLYTHLLNFRKYQVVLTADIEKMYRQVNIREEDRVFQKILWRASPEEEMGHFKLNTITYGMGPSSFLATRCLKQLSMENAHLYPEASLILEKDFYMDDLITGGDDVESCNLLKEQLISIMNSAGMNLRKWRSNSSDLSSEAGQATDMVILDKPEGEKILGLAWNCQKDSFLYHVVLPSHPIYNKRNILSLIASIFDPLGLLGPVTVNAKLIMQRLWQEKISWDEEIPIEILKLWKKYLEDLKGVNSFQIPRKIICNQTVNIQLHGFCDASQKAYAACVYMLSTDQSGKRHSQLITAKSRVAPLKTISLPKLELCGAVLLTKVVEKVKESLLIPLDKTFYWCDSTITLCWIGNQPARWNTFVANRVAEIQERSETSQWKHVNSEDNAADILSRGTSAKSLFSSEIWWRGPNWLTQDEVTWPNYKEICIDPPELKTKINLTVSMNKDWELFYRFSSLTRLQRVTAYILRFINNTRKTHTFSGQLSIIELNKSLQSLIIVAQSYSFSKEIKTLKAGKNLDKSSHLKSLSPFIHMDLLHVGGRLSRGKLIHEAQKHPILLPHDHPLTKLIIKHFHYTNLHVGTQTLLALIRLKYWPIMAKNAIKKILKNCIVCFKCSPKTSHQIMSDLPEDRVSPCRSFSVTGLDYAGPILIKSGISRRSNSVKSYICLFICFSTKAVHLELVTSLTTDAFLNCLKRFISRRGKPSKLYSDNATTFVGANNELKNMYNLYVSQKEIANYLTNMSIQWVFIPPKGPHHGGLWESNIKSVKYHVKRVANVSSLTYEEMCTLLYQIESCINSRPLIPLSNDPLDLFALTPGHFLIGDNLSAVAEPDLQQIPINRLNNFQKLSQLRQSFWSRWRIEYLGELQQRTKWTDGNRRQLKTGDLVIIKDDNAPPNLWRMGRVIATHPGQDGITRVVTLKTQQGSMKRPITKLCLLPMDDAITS